MTFNSHEALDAATKITEGRVYYPMWNILFRDEAYKPMCSPSEAEKISKTTRVFIWNASVRATREPIKSSLFEDMKG